MQNLPAPKRFTYQSQDGLTLVGFDWQPENWHENDLTVLCLAGLSRNTRDFQDIATYLSGQGLRTVCLDYRGRGESDWAKDWESYSLPVEAQDIDLAIETLGLKQFAVLGTSRGGLHAMMMALRYPRERMRGVILNDIGPEIERDALIRLSKSIGQTMRFEDIQACAEALKAGLENQFPDLDQRDWLKFAEQLGSAQEDHFVLDYDPALGRTLQGLEDGNAPWPDLWPLFEALKPFPLMIIHGELSDLLSAQTTKRMLASHPQAGLHLVERQGHAPLLWEMEIFQEIIRFFRGLASKPHA